MEIIHQFPQPDLEKLGKLQIEENGGFFANVQDISRNPLALYLWTQAPFYRKQLLKHAIEFAEILAGRPVNPADFPWWEIQYNHMLLIRTTLQQRFAFNTVNSRLSGVKGILRQCWRLGLMTSEDFFKAVSIERVPYERKGVVRKRSKATPI